MFCQNFAYSLGPKADVFSYHTTIVPTIYTKRSILSTIAKLYDPIGALGPIIFWAKFYMQIVWQTGVQWDEPVSKTILNDWIKFSSELPLVLKIQISRYFSCLNYKIIQLIGF